MTISSELEAKILDQLGEFGEMKSDVRTLKDDMADVKKDLAELVGREQQSRGARNAIIAGIGAIGGLIGSGIIDLFLKLTGKN
jgi:hypothetical protein